MSSFVRFGVAAVCGVVLLVLLEILVASPMTPGSRVWFTTVARIILYGLAAIAAGAAASKFGWWGEHFGRAWTLFSFEFVVLIINYILRRAAPDAILFLSITLIGANLAQIAGYWLMARALNAAGIGYLTSRTKKILMTVAALAVAIILCQSSLLAQWQTLQAGNVQTARLISVLSDVITFTLVAPLAMSTIALRGGQLSWIYAYLSISVFGWMVNEGAGSIDDFFGGSSNALRTTRTAGIAIASLFSAAAAATQYLAAHRAMKGSGIDG